MGGGFVMDNQKPTCSKTLKPNVLPPLPPPVVDFNGEREASSPSFLPILAPPPSLVTTDDTDNENQFNPPSSMLSMAPPPPSTATGHNNKHFSQAQATTMPSMKSPPPTTGDGDNGNYGLPPFRSAFPNVYEQRFGHSQNSWFPSGRDNQQGAYSNQMDSTRYHQPNNRTDPSFYQNQGSIYNNKDFISDHSYANRGPSTADYQEKVHKPCMANEIFSFLKTCVHQLDVAMTHGPASSKLSSCVHVLQEIRTVIINGENQFNYDLIHNGHKGHDYTYCGNGTLRKRNASTQVEQETEVGNTIETVTLSPAQDERMDLN